eukprot:4163120-Amphidinium_carterae.1
MSKSQRAKTNAAKMDPPQMKANGECFALDDGGCDHMVLPMSFLPTEMKDSPHTSRVKVLLAAGHSNGVLCQEEVFGNEVKTPLVPTNKVSRYLKLKHVIENGVPCSWVIPATGTQPEVVLMTLQGKRYLYYYSHTQFECIRRAMLDYLRGQRTIDLKYWQHLMAADHRRKWIRVFHLQAMTVSPESMEVEAPCSDMTEESLAECCDEAMKQISKKIPLAVARTNIWDPQSPPRSMQFGPNLLPTYLTITLNEYTTHRLRVNKHNRSSSIVIAFGDFTRGELWIEREGGAHHPPKESCSTEEKLLLGHKLPVPIRHQFQADEFFYVPGRVEALTIEHWAQLAELRFPTHSFAESTMVHLAAATLPSKSDQALLKKLDDILYKSTKIPAIKCRSPLEVAKLEAHERFGHFPKDPDCPACQMESRTKVDHPRSDPILLPWHLPVLSKGGNDVTLPCFEIINRIPFIKPLRPCDARVLRIFSDQGSEYLNKIFRNEAMHLGIAMVQSPTYQPSSNDIAEKAVQVHKAGARRLIEASGLPQEYWNCALAYFSEFMRHAALDLPFKLPAFGELVAVWHSRSKESIHSMSPRGQVGRMLTCYMMGTKECKILVGDPEEQQIVKGLKAHPVPKELCTVQRPEALPDQWTDISMRAVRRLWTFTQDPTGVPVWMNNMTGVMHSICGAICSGVD